MDFHHTYYTLSGLAYTEGLDSFDEVMPKSRVLSLFNACLETKGFSWVESSFANWIICVAGRELRNRGDFEPSPECMANCTYRMPYEPPGLQRNALRVEIFSPSDRCGFRLKDGCIGGMPNDYYPCTFNQEKNNDFPQASPFNFGS